MNQNEAVEFLPIIQALADGKPIEVLDCGGTWSVSKDLFFNLPVKCYRIKPEPKYRPFANAKECWAEMQKYQPFGWIKCKEGYFNIVYVNDYYVGLADKDSSSILLASKNSYQDNAFADGTPFGVKE